MVWFVAELVWFITKLVWSVRELPSFMTKLPFFVKKVFGVTLTIFPHPARLINLFYPEPACEVFV
jgi:hypothetical protein